MCYVGGGPGCLVLLTPHPRGTVSTVLINQCSIGSTTTLKLTETHTCTHAHPHIAMPPYTKRPSNALAALIG